MIKIVCNRCEKDIIGNTGYIAWNFKDRSTGDIVGQNIFENYDYCEECMREIKNFIMKDILLINQTAAPPAAASLVADTDSTASTQEAVGQVKDDKKSKRNSQIDLGKVNALRKAGWSIGSIAEEMRVDSEDIALAIYNQKKRAAKAAKTR